ncbi:PhnE/PtxC family ABC transporter permease [Shewanella sp. GXUN23E]|uniref:PhnE/PtxC family ABC transporter permease n=1 Tax=Shewanella sp. GXUN23E TaxID=3422498 RepID=UPI003D7CF402
MPQKPSSPAAPHWHPGPWQWRTALLYSLFAIAWYLADIAVLTIDPWHELQLIAQGILRPGLGQMEFLLRTVWQTVAFALLGVALALPAGLMLALGYQHKGIALGCALVRGVHELFWALLLMQIFGLAPLTGILAIALPFAATFARVFYDMLRLAPAPLEHSLPGDWLSRFVYGRMAKVWPLMASYIRYRFECALRSSAVLGFIGLPTLGFYLESAYSQGQYALGGALLLLFILLIGTLKYWARRTLLPFYLLAAWYWLPAAPALDSLTLLQQFLHDLLPPLQLDSRPGNTNVMTLMQGVSDWFAPLFYGQILPGVAATLLLALAALGLTHLLTLLCLPLASRRFWPGWLSGQLASLALRSTPEYLLAFVFVLLVGPSMLPGILALALHNAALLVFLLARQADELPAQSVPLNSFDDWHFRVLPVLYPNAMALLLYRFEVILRESAILGMIGVMTLGFYVDSAFAELRLANAAMLLLFTALLNMLVDALSQRLQARAVRPMAC